MDPELLALLESLSPEELQQLMGMGTLDERGALANQQQARADALRNYEAPRMGTVGGAIGAGLGDVFREVGGGIAANRAQADMTGLLGKKDSGRSLYAEILRRMKGAQSTPGAGTMGMGDLVPDTSGGLLG